MEHGARGQPNLALAAVALVDRPALQFGIAGLAAARARPTFAPAQRKQRRPALRLGPEPLPELALAQTLDPPPNPTLRTHPLTPPRPKPAWMLARGRLGDTDNQLGIWLAPSALWHVVLAAGLVARFSELGIWLASSASRYVALPPGLVARFSELEIWLAPSALWYVVLAGGLVLVVLGSAGERSIQRPRDWLLRAADGFLAITHVTKLFGDVLSYMRLFALGLASASLATTFNALAGEIAHGLSGIGILFAILVLLFGHTINIALGILSGVVHGLRLNYIEFFGWALAGEGQPFKAFAHRSTVE